LAPHSARQIYVGWGGRVAGAKPTFLFFKKQPFYAKTDHFLAFFAPIHAKQKPLIVLLVYHRIKRVETGTYIWQGYRLFA
jgi:hypothetical protein